MEHTGLTRLTDKDEQLKLLCYCFDELTYMTDFIENCLNRRRDFLATFGAPFPFDLKNDIELELKPDFDWDTCIIYNKNYKYQTHEMTDAIKSGLNQLRSSQTLKKEERETQFLDYYGSYETMEEKAKYEIEVMKREITFYDELKKEQIDKMIYNDYNKYHDYFSTDLYKSLTKKPENTDLRLYFYIRPRAVYCKFKKELGDDYQEVLDQLIQKKDKTSKEIWGEKVEGGFDSFFVLIVNEITATTTSKDKITELFNKTDNVKFIVSNGPFDFPITNTFFC